MLTGQGRYVSDVRLDDALVVTFVRSAVASATILSLDLEAARCVAGVHAIFTGSDLRMLGELPVNPVLDTNRLPGYPVLAVDQVLAVGQPVVAIVASSEQAGLDAADLVVVELEESRPSLFSETASTTPCFARTWATGDDEQVFRDADHIVSARVEHPRLVPLSMEPRAIAVAFDADSDGLTIWLSSQTPHRARHHLARILSVEPTRLRVISPDVGGAFGLKASLYPEEVFVVWAAIILKRSVRWSASRSEDFLSATHGRGGVTLGELAVSGAGQFLGLRAEIHMPLGHWLPNSAAIPAWNAARILPGPYQVPTVSIGTEAVLSNTAAVGIYRGAGRPEAAALMEQLVERAALATGLDSFEIRRRNLIRSEQMPYDGPTGIRIDSGRYHEALEMLKAEASYDQLQEALSRRRDAGELVGAGLAVFIEPCGTGWESARVCIDQAGSITAFTGGSSQGQGRETAYAKIVADQLGVDSQTVTVVHGDTARCPDGIGALASRSTAIGGSAMQEAARRASVALGAGDQPDAISKEVVYEPDGEAWGYGLFLAVVAVDGETGRVSLEQIVVVDDIGAVVNKDLVRGQILGGIAQGVGEALFERVVYDHDGQLLTGSLMDYAVPRAADMPPVTIKSLETRSPFNGLGAKGVGEAGTIGAPAAIANALHNALSDYDVRSLSMPFTSVKVWQILQTLKSGN